MSIAGGVEKSILAAVSVQCNCLQIFTASNNRWEGKFPGKESVRLFKEYRDVHSISGIVSHNSYLHNLASPDPGLYEKSIHGLFEELKRCDTLEIPFLVIHPGAATDGDRESGIKRIGKAVRKLIQHSRHSDIIICFEITAGQGTVLGSSFDELFRLMELAGYPSRTGICLDTCHLFAAGIDFSSERKYRRMMRDFNGSIGLDYLKVIHFNDSKHPFHSKKDRHEHIGKGFIGTAPFGFFMNDKTIKHVPKILETKKGKDLAEDIMNLKTLRSLII